MKKKEIIIIVWLALLTGLYIINTLALKRPVTITLSFTSAEDNVGYLGPKNLLSEEPL